MFKYLQDNLASDQDDPQAEERQALSVWLAGRLPEILQHPMFGLRAGMTPQIKNTIWSKPIITDESEVLGFVDIWVEYTDGTPEAVIHQVGFLVEIEIEHTAATIRRLRLFEQALRGELAQLLPITPNLILPARLGVFALDAEDFDLETLPQQGYFMLNALGLMLSPTATRETPIADLIEFYPARTALAEYTHLGLAAPGASAPATEHGQTSSNSGGDA